MAEAFNLTAQINLRGPTNLKAVVADIKKELGSVTSSVDIKLDARAAKSLDNTAKSLKNVNNALTNAKNNSATLSSSLLSLSGSLKNVGQGTTVIDKGVRSASKNMNSLGSASKEASGALESLGKNARITAKRFLIYTAVTRVFYGFTNAIDGAFKRYVEFDKQIIRLQQVTKNGSLGIKGLVGEIDRLSTSLGVSSEKLSQTAVTLSQAGFSANQTKQALEALATTELAPTFSDITKTTEGAIAAMKQFKLETGQLKEALGSINAVAGAFAVESDDIIAAIQRAGGVFAAASIGVEKLDGSLKTGQEALNEFIGVFTSVRSQTRESAETIATGLRTIFTRIQRGSTIEYLKQFNVELQNQEGQFVGAYEAVRRLSAGLKDLDNRDPRFIKIVEELGGFRQIGKVLPLLQNFATAQEAVEIATSGVASLDKARNQGLQSLAVQLAKVNEQAFSLFKTIGDSKVFRGFLSVVLSLASSLIGLAKAFKPLLPVLAVLATLKIAKGIGNFASGLGGAIKAGGGAKGVGGGIGRSLTGTAGAGTRQETVALSQNTSALKNLTNAVINLGNKITSSRNNFGDGGKVLGFNSGGVVPGSGNRDSVPAMLTPGEIVIDKKTANKYGGGLIQKFAGGGESISMTELIEQGSPQLRGRSNSQDELRQYFQDVALGQIQAKAAAKKLLGKKYSMAGEALISSSIESKLLRSLESDPMLEDILSEYEGQPIGEKAKARLDELGQEILKQLTVAIPTVSALGPNITPELLEDGIKRGEIGSSLGTTVNASLYRDKDTRITKEIPKGENVFFGEKQRSLTSLFGLRKSRAEKKEKVDKVDARIAGANLSGLSPTSSLGDEDVFRRILTMAGESAIAERRVAGGSEADRLEKLAAMIAEGPADAAEVDGDVDLAKNALGALKKWNSSAKKGEWTQLNLAQAAIDYIKDEVSDPNTRSALAAKYAQQLKTFDEDFAKALNGEPLKNVGRARAIQSVANAILKANYAKGGLVQRFAKGGTVSAMVSNGEAYIPPNLAKQIGYSKLAKMNQADRNGISGFSRGGISVFKGPGNGTSDSIGPIGLPEGSFVLREKATKALGLASGGIVQKFAEGGSGTPINIGQQIGYKTQVLKKLEAAQAEAEANFMRVASSLEKLDNALVAGEINNKNYTRVIEQKVALEKSVIKAEQDYENITKQVVAVSAQRAKLLAQPIAEKEARKSEQAAKAEESRAAMDTYNKREDKKARVADAYKDAAARAGKSPVEFNKQLRKNLIGRTSELKKQYAGTRADITTNLVQTRAKGLGSTDEIENFQRELGEKIVSIYGKIDANQLQDTLDGIAISIMDGSSLPELIDKFPVLADVMDESLDSMRGVYQGQEEVIGQLGGLADELKLTADDIAEIDWRESGGAESLGLFGKVLDAGKNAGFRQGGAYEFAQSDTGKRLQELQKKYSDFGDGIADKLGGISPILGKSVKGIASFSKVLGGIPGLAGAAGTILSDQFLPSLLKMGGLDNTAAGAGIQGAFTEGAAGATLGATIGNAILPGIGGIIGSVAGAITGAIDGFIKGFKTKKLELTLSKLEGAITALNKSFTDYEEVQSQANLDRIYQNISDANTISTDLQVQSQVDYGQQALSSAAKTTAASGAIAAAAVLLGVATAGTATVIVGAAALIAGALTYFTATADELDNQALAAYLGNLQQLNSALKQVAGIEIDKIELDPIQEVLDGIKTAKESESIYGGLKDTAIVQAGMKTGLTENQVYQRAAEEVIYQQSGGDEKLARKAMDELGSDELIKRGKEIVQLRTEQLYAEKKLSIQLRESQIEVENLVNKFEKVNAVIKAFSDGLDEFDANLKNQISSIRGEGKVNAASRRNINILRNPRGYDQAQFNAAAERAGGLIGGETGQQAEQGLKAQRILDEQLPQILRDTSDQNTDAVTDKIAESLKGAGISASLTDSITKSLGETLDAKIGSRQGVSFDELSQNVPALTESLKGLQEQTKAAIAAEELFAKAMDQSAEYANEYVDALQNLRQRETQAITARIEGENRIAEALGERLSYEDRASTFFAELDSLAPGFRRGSEIDIQGITDERNAIRQRREGLEAQKAASSDPKLIGELNQQIADLANEDKNLVGALELVADSTQMLDAALSAYTDRIAKENKQIGFMDRLATADPGELLQINSELGAVNTALSADPEAQKRFFADRTNRQNALAGLQQLDALGLDDKQFRQLEAQAKLSVFENTPGMSQLLDMKPAGGGDSVREILEKRAQGIATPEEENARQALELQKQANDALIKMQAEEADTMRAAITEPLKQAILALPGAIAAAIKGDTAATAGAAGVGGGTGSGSGGAGGGGTGSGTGSGSGTTGSAGGRGNAPPLSEPVQTELDAATEEVNRYRSRRKEDAEDYRKMTEDPVAYFKEQGYTIDSSFTGAMYNPTTGDLTTLYELQQRREKERSRLLQDPGAVRAEQRYDRAQAAAENERAFLEGQQNPYAPSSRQMPSNLQLPSFPGVSSTTLPSTLGGAGPLGSLDLSGLMANVDGVTTALNELKSSVDLAGTAFGAVQAFLTTTNIPLVLDDASTTTLNAFNTDFGNYVDKLSKINLPDTINIVGRHTVTVNINGGEAFTAMEESLSELIVTEVNTQLRRQTEGQLGSNYNR